MSDETDQIGYAAAMAELQDILDHLEGDDLDVDVLASHVERASLLIEVCRTRINNARVKVEAVVADLESSTSTPTDPDESGDELDDDPADDDGSLRLLDEP